MHLIILSIFLSLSTFANQYPDHWWKVIDEEQRQGSWEILPHECKKGVELILSKRNELGVFSNFGHTPFKLDGVKYQSIEALWQMMKYPNIHDSNDPRNQFVYPYTRYEVIQMHGFETKEAGDIANSVNESAGIKWVSYQAKKFNYKDFAEGSLYHYEIMKKAIYEKVMQNPEVKKLLLQTGDLILLPDHHQGNNRPPSYFYHKILMNIRDSLNE